MIMIMMTTTMMYKNPYSDLVDVCTSSQLTQAWASEQL